VPLTIVNAVNHAWQLIQLAHDNWQWMRGEFTATLGAVVPPAQARFSPTSLGISRFGDYIYDQIGSPVLGQTYRPMTIYDASIGVSDESELQYMEWENFRSAYFRGTQAQNRPTNWSADPALNFCLGKALNKSYVVKGEYFKDYQDLTVQVGSTSIDLNVPEMPPRFHMGIVWRAVLILTEKDEADQLVYDRAENKYAEILGRLEVAQLPHITMGGSPIA
jgi:hypothetical protein